MSDPTATEPNDQVRAEVRAAVAELVREELDPAHDETPLSMLYAQYDSLAVIDCVGSVEQRFGVSIDLVDDDLRTSFASVASIDDLVRRKLADRTVLDVSF
ncbi:phosphopantetheine-binding protein [Micromonospora sp. WMMD734]|uniref:phosphopantetheine-binding protein n=1 Tax=Micromonospora sp. WMMD734 TaxID=3404129 RepID=UPI003B9641D5